MDRRQFLATPILLPTIASQFPGDRSHDFRRVLVAIYYMPDEPGGLLRRPRPAYCPACEVLKADEPHIKAAFPSVGFGVSNDGRSPALVVTDDGGHWRFRTNKANIRAYPMVVIYSGSMGSFGEERYRMVGYRQGDRAKLEQMIQWAAEI